jgi:hypothetical protein
VARIDLDDPSILRDKVKSRPIDHIFRRLIRGTGQS